MGITWCSNVYQNWRKPLHSHHDSNISFKEGFHFPNEDDARKFNASSLNKNIKRNLIDEKVKDPMSHSPPSLEYTNSQSHKLCSTTVLEKKKLIHSINTTHSELFSTGKLENTNNLSDNFTTKSIVLDETPMNESAQLKRQKYDYLDVQGQKKVSPNVYRSEFLPIKTPSPMNNEKVKCNSRSKKIEIENTKQNKTTSLFGKKEMPSKVQIPSSIKTEAGKIEQNIRKDSFVESQSAEKNKMNVRKSKEKFVDDFGNPLLRGAGSEQVISFRECRGLCKETRDLLDQAKRSKTKTEVELLTRQDSSRFQQKKSSDSFSDESKLMNKNDIASTMKKEEFVIERVNLTGNEGTNVKQHPFHKFSRRIFRGRKAVNADDIIPPFLQQ